MKELTIEEKARRYDEALEKARQLCAYPTTKPFISDLQDLFPELRESEDEKIRKDIIAYIETANQILPQFQKDKWIAWLEKQGEQKPTDKVEPKFKVGDIVKYTNHHKQPIYKIVSIGKECYICESDDVTLGDMAVMHFTFDNPYLRLIKQKQEWSEEDVCRMNILCHFLEEYGNQYYGHLMLQGTISWLKSLKERVQSQPKQEWNEEDEYHKRQILRILKGNGCSQTLQKKTEKWIEERLKSLGPQSRWKPSDEQINALKFVMEDIEKDSLIYPVLNSVLEDLKKLREE